MILTVGGAAVLTVVILGWVALLTFIALMFVLWAGGVIAETLGL